MIVTDERLAELAIRGPEIEPDTQELSTEELRALVTEIQRMRPVYNAALEWRLTPPVDRPIERGGSTAAWVRAHRKLETSIDVALELAGVPPVVIPGWSKT